jgi:hypothetical protein
MRFTYFEDVDDVYIPFPNLQNFSQRRKKNRETASPAPTGLLSPEGNVERRFDDATQGTGR